MMVVVRQGPARSRGLNDASCASKQNKAVDFHVHGRYFCCSKASYFGAMRSAMVS